MKPLKIQEKLLLLKVRKKDPDAFGQIYDLYVTSIYRFIYFKVANRADAEDLTSEVFLKIWQYLIDCEDEIDNLRALIYKFARNLVIDFYRQRAKRELIGDEEMMLKVEDSRQQNILSQIETKSDLGNIEIVLAGVKDVYREVLVLRYIEELSISEMAKILEKSKGSVRVLLHRALKIVREGVKKNESG